MLLAAKGSCLSNIRVIAINLGPNYGKPDKPVSVEIIITN
jgi:hypothetical protein